MYRCEDIKNLLTYVLFAVAGCQWLLSFVERQVIVMTTTLLSSHHPGLYCHDVDVCFTCLPQLSTSLNDDAVCPSYDVCSLLSVDVIQPQMSTFQVTASTSLWSSDSTGPQHVVVDNQHALGDETSSSGHNIQMSVVNDASWPNSDELMSSSELDECLSHLLMTSQPGCHGNYNNVAADWQSELSAVNQLAEQIQPSQCDVDRLHVATSASLSDQESILHTSLRTEVKSPTFACHDTDSDEGAFNFCHNTARCFKSWPVAYLMSSFFRFVWTLRAFIRDVTCRLLQLSSGIARQKLRHLTFTWSECQNGGARVVSGRLPASSLLTFYRILTH